MDWRLGAAKLGVKEKVRIKVGNTYLSITTSVTAYAAVTDVSYSETWRSLGKKLSMQIGKRKNKKQWCQRLEIE